MITSDAQIVILKRSENVAEAPGLYDIPGGHPEPEVRIPQAPGSARKLCFILMCMPGCMLGLCLAKH